LTQWATTKSTDCGVIALVRKTWWKYYKEFSYNFWQNFFLNIQLYFFLIHFTKKLEYKWTQNLKNEENFDRFSFAYFVFDISGGRRRFMRDWTSKRRIELFWVWVRFFRKSDREKNWKWDFWKVGFWRLPRKRDRALVWLHCLSKRLNMPWFFFSSNRLRESKT